MAEILENAACLAWLILAALVFTGMRKWNKRFSELYDELKQQIEEEDDG